MTYEQAFRVSRLARLIRDHRLGNSDGVVAILFQDRRRAPWDDLVETRADGSVVGWQIKNLTNALPSETIANLLNKLDDEPALRGVLAISHPIDDAKQPIPITALRGLAETATAASGQLDRWELPDRVEQQKLDVLGSLVFPDVENRNARVFALLERLDVRWFGNQDDLLVNAVDVLGRCFADPEAVVTALRDLVLSDGVHGVRLDYELLEQRVLAKFAPASVAFADLPAPPASGMEVLYWLADGRGVGRTLWLAADGQVRAQAQRVIVNSGSQAWELAQTGIPVEVLQCNPFDVCDYDDPPTEVTTVRASELRDVYSGATIPLSILAAGDDGWVVDAEQEISLLGGVDGILLVRLHLWVDGGGVRPEYETLFRVLDLSRGGTSLSLWSEAEAREWESTLGLPALNALRLARRLIEPEPFTDCKLTQASLLIDNSMQMKARLQFTAEVCHADADLSWDDFSVSQLVEIEGLPSQLSGAAPPDALLRHWKTNPLPGLPVGWSFAPQSVERREALWRRFS